MRNLFYVATRREIEVRRRIKLTVAAYAYEKCDHSIMPDHVYDAECRLVDLSIDTGNAKMDAWFRENFDPSTGQWIHRHPELGKVRHLYESNYAKI